MFLSSPSFFHEFLILIQTAVTTLKTIRHTPSPKKPAHLHYSYLVVHLYTNSKYKKKKKKNRKKCLPSPCVHASFQSDLQLLYTGHWLSYTQRRIFKSRKKKISLYWPKGSSILFFSLICVCKHMSVSDSRARC